MNFKGMDPEQGRSIAGEIKKCGTEVLGALQEVQSIVTGVEWKGPDYDAFVEDWAAFISGPVGEVGTLLQGKGDELMAHAEEQEQTSINS